MAKAIRPLHDAGTDLEDDAGGERYIGRAARIAHHLEGLGERVLVGLLREADWLVIRAVLAVPRAGQPARLLRFDTASGLLDDGWKNAAVFVSYAQRGAHYSFRTVVREVTDHELLTDPADEIRLFAPPLPGRFRVAREPEEVGPRAEGYVVLETEHQNDDAALDVFATVAGADLHLRFRHHATRIANRARVRALIDEAVTASQLALTLDGDHRVYGVGVSCHAPLGAATGLEAVYQGNHPNARPGRVVQITALVGGELYTFPAKVIAVFEDRLHTAMPAEVYRYQRRGTARRQVRWSKLPLVLRTPRGMELQNVELRDLSLTGAGLLGPRAIDLQIGEQVTLVLGASGRAVEFDALCVRKDVAHTDEHGRIQIGLQFVDLTPKRLRTLDRLMQRLCE